MCGAVPAEDRAEPAHGLVRGGRRRLPAARGGELVPPDRQLRRLAIGEGERGELGECARIHRALEVDDLAHRLPPGSPAPAIELRLAGPAEIEAHILRGESQQEPTLPLADAKRPLVAADVARGQPVAQPLARPAEELHAVAPDSDLLIELAEHGVLDLFPLAHPALRKLPATPAGPSPEKHLVLVQQHDTDVGTKTLRVDDILHGGRKSATRRPPQ